MNAATVPQVTCTLGAATSCGCITHTARIPAVITDEDIARVTENCRSVPRTDNEYVATDYVSALLDTVLDFQMHTTAVRNAIAHFDKERWDEMRTLADLKDDGDPLYTKDRPAQLVVACDKTLCGQGGVTSFPVLVDLFNTGDFELAPEFGEVVNLAVEHHPHGLVLVGHRLVPAVKIDD